MEPDGVNAETMLIKATVVSLAVQNLLSCLQARGVLSAADLIIMRDQAMEVAEAMQALSASDMQIRGHRLEAEIAIWWNTVNQAPADK